MQEIALSGEGFSAISSLGRGLTPARLSYFSEITSYVLGVLYYSSQLSILQHTRVLYPSFYGLCQILPTF